MVDYHQCIELVTIFSLLGEEELYSVLKTVALVTPQLVGQEYAVSRKYFSQTMVVRLNVERPNVERVNVDDPK